MKKYLYIVIILILGIGLVLIGHFGTKNNSTNNSISKIYSSSDLFTSRDLEQSADLTNATTYTVSDGEDITITKAGVYIITGEASNVTIYVTAGSSDKVQLVLNDLTITNSDFPCIYVKTADKVFVTTSSDSKLSVTGEFKTDGTKKVNSVIYSKTDLVLNGTATLTISSTGNGIDGKDDLKITGGNYNITASIKGISANDSIRIADGTITIKAGTDGLHAENSDDDSKGYIYIGGGDITISSSDDGIHATSVLQVDDGNVNITSVEGIEGTYLQLNGGTIDIKAEADGVNAASKSSSYTPTLEMNAGSLTIEVTGVDSDAIDSNGDIYINGGTTTIKATSAFDYTGTAKLTGGTLIINGEKVNSIPESTK